MKETLTYLFELTVCSGVFFAVYVALFERRTPFRWCRFYLLATVGLSLVIPLLRIPVWPGPTLTMTPYVPVDFADMPVALVEEEAPTDWWVVAFRMIYGVGMLVVAIPTLRQLWTIRRIRRGAQLLRTDEYTLVRTPERIDACSFFRTIYIWQGTPDEELPVILLHEASHVRHRHSVERIVMETMKALLWWNPFVWLAAGRLNEVEEFEADGDVLRSGCSVRFYMQLILKQLLGYSPDITNGLRNSRTKKRFIMMTTNNSHRHVLLRLAGAAPALIGLLCAFSFTTRAAEIIYPDTETSIVGTPEQPEDAVVRAEVMPKFHDGDLNTFRQWVQTQVRMPEKALKNKLQGRVVATFTIEKDGTLDDIQILQTPDRVFSEEVERVLRRSDKWTPGTQDGKAVRVKFTLPVDFRIANVDVPGGQGAAPAASATTIDELVVVGFAPADSEAAAEEEAFWKASMAEEKAGADQPFLMVEVMPAFRGGNLNVFRQWVQTQVRMPEMALKNKLQGRVVATFIIEKDGTLDDIQILQTPDRVFSEEVERVLKLSDKWTPGTQDGKAVRVRYTLPVDFRLAGVAPDDQGAAPAASATTAEELVVVAYPKKDPAGKSVTVHATVQLNNKPLAGAIVQEMGSTNGTVTDAEGHATIKTYAGRTLNVLYPECGTYYYTAGKADTQEINISLTLSARTEQSADGSVAVSGHGTQPNPEKPMLIVDDKEYEGSLDYLNELDPNDIAAMSIYKANGENAIVITTKKKAQAGASADER